MEAAKRPDCNQQQEDCSEEFHLDYFIRPLRDGGFPQLLSKQHELQAALADEERTAIGQYKNALALLAMSDISSVAYKVNYAQSIVNQAIAACALERYRIEHNAYPETLEAANRPGEKPIPLDVLSGRPMGYRKTADGRYALWCVGFSGKDHGGELRPGSGRACDGGAGF